MAYLETVEGGEKTTNVEITGEQHLIMKFIPLPVQKQHKENHQFMPLIGNWFRMGKPSLSNLIIENLL